MWWHTWSLLSAPCPLPHRHVSACRGVGLSVGWYPWRADRAVLPLPTPQNMNLPNVKVDLPVLQPKDIDDLQNFAVPHKVDFIAASFVQVRTPTP